MAGTFHFEENLAKTMVTTGVEGDADHLQREFQSLNRIDAKNGFRPSAFRPVNFEAASKTLVLLLRGKNADF